MVQSTSLIKYNSLSQILPISWLAGIAVNRVEYFWKLQVRSKFLFIKNIAIFRGIMKKYTSLCQGVSLGRVVSVGG